MLNIMILRKLRKSKNETLIYPIIFCLAVLGNINNAIAETFKDELKYYEKIDLPYTSNNITKYYWEDEA